MSVSDDRSIRIWSIDDTSCIQILYGHTARVWDARFLSDGHRMVSIGEDAACIIWNCNEGTILKKFEGHKGKIKDLHLYVAYLISGLKTFILTIAFIIKYS